MIRANDCIQESKTPRANILSRYVLAALALIFVCTAASADPSLPHLFSDHMVLQRNAPIHIWGHADAGEKITVTLGQSASDTVAGANGEWEVNLPPMDAGGPFLLTVRGKQTIEIKDVMIGEVWVASGQSNMAFALNGATGGEEEIANANHPEIRLFTVPGLVAATPQSDTRPAGWKLCTPESAKDFSAVAFFFARHLQESLHVPVGIIHTSWPGSAAEEWVTPESLRGNAILKPIADRWAALPADVRSFAAGPESVDLEFDDFELLPSPDSSEKPLPLSSFDNASDSVAPNGHWTYSWSDAPQTVFSLVSPGRGGSGYAASITGEMAELDSSRLVAAFQASGVATDLHTYGGIRFWVRGKSRFKFQALQPTIIDWDNYETKILQATPDWQQVTIWFKDLKQEGWGVKQPLTLASLLGFQLETIPEAGDSPRPPSGLYDGMIVPLKPYRIRGAIWYQGESNTWRSYQYRSLLPALIDDWRKAWQEGNFPFLIVQLPNQGSSPELGDSIWAELREAQLFTLRTVPDTGLAVTIDVGDPNNLHPPRKREIGDRLALWALGTTYGEKLVYSGPLYRSAQVQGDAVRIQFDLFGSSLATVGGPLKGFSIAGADRKFHWAEARIEGDTLVVSSAAVPSPVAVRYDWADSPEGNLFNEEGLPASPFRTDDWPGATFDKR
ncbi:MAG TPA: sialate O-acetylesterase [Candidatus Limnocylindrales bacterium]|nr:sialate O-acetylesterase [Candidatus Limnocylindrales bacterium]